MYEYNAITIQINEWYQTSLPTHPKDTK